MTRSRINERSMFIEKLYCFLLAIAPVIFLSDLFQVQSHFIICLPSACDGVKLDAIVRCIHQPTIHLTTLHHGLGNTVTECNCIYTNTYMYKATTPTILDATTSGIK